MADLKVKCKKAFQVKGKEAKGKRIERQSFMWNVRDRLLPFILFTFAFLLLPLSAAAQDDPSELAPPPLKAVSKDERSRLEQESDVKSHTKLALEMMNIRLGSAEKLCAAADYDSMFRELGDFHALMENSLDYLLKRDTGVGKVLDNFKRLEIGLRGFSPRLETIRRELPLRYEDYVRKLIIHVRDTRAKAVDPMFADTVVPPHKSDL